MEFGWPSAIRVIQVSLLGLFALATLGFSQSAKADIATIEGYGNVVYWSIDPGIRYQRIKVTLASSTGEVVVIETDQDPATGVLEDGSYKYELVLSPRLSRAVRAEMKAAREAAGGQEASGALRKLKKQGKLPGRAMIQSGFFRIADGQLVAADAAQE